MRHPVSRFTAAAIFVFVVTGVAVWFHGGGTTPAFADFITPILEGKGVKYKMTVVMKGSPPVKFTSDVMMLNDARIRQETQIPNMPKMVMIQDSRQRKSLSLNIATKTATVVTFTNRPKYKASEDKDPLAGFRMLLLDARDNQDKPGAKREPLGEKVIDGRRVVGFHISSDRGDMNLWGDPKTGLPVRIEITSGWDGNMKATMSDFEFNVDMDESLFSLEPPAGYTVENQTMDGSPQEEKDLIEAFREYSKLTGGAFPDSLESRKVTFTFWKKLNFQSMWTNFPTGKEKPDKEFEEQMSKIMDEMADKTLAGKMNEEEKQKLVEQMQKITMKKVAPTVFQRMLEDLALTKWKPNEEQRHQFEERLLKVMIKAKPNGEQNHKMMEETRKIMVQMLWEDLSPAKWKTNDERRQQFGELMSKRLEVESNEEQKQKIDGEIRKTLGDQMFNDVKAWEDRMQKATEARAAKMQKAAKDSAKVQEARSREFMEAQQRVGRGIMFANQLPPAADAHYAGKGVSLGAADTPIFWYRPKDAKKYRVIYADLSVKDMTPDDVKELSGAKTK